MSHEGPIAKKSSSIFLVNFYIFLQSMNRNMDKMQFPPSNQPWQQFWEVLFGTRQDNSLWLLCYNSLWNYVLVCKKRSQFNLISTWKQCLTNWTWRTDECIMIKIFLYINMCINVRVSKRSWKWYSTYLSNTTTSFKWT